VWDEAYIADVEAEAAEEVVQWGEQAAILASLNAHRFQSLKEEERDFFNNANLEYAVEISYQRVATEEMGRLLTAAERQKLIATPTTSKRGSPTTRRLGNGWQRGDSAAGKLL
jgi:phosphoglucomutase